MSRLRRGHRSEIMFGVLVVILCGDGVAVLGFSSRECQIPLIVSLGILRFGTGSIRNPTLCVARDRRSGSTVIPVALLVIFHSTPCVAVKKHLARARPRPNYRPATIPSLVRHTVGCTAQGDSHHVKQTVTQPGCKPTRQGSRFGPRRTKKPRQSGAKSRP